MLLYWFLEGDEGLAGSGNGVGSGGGEGGGGDGGGGDTSEGEGKPEVLTADSVRAIVADSVKPLHETIGQLRERNTSLEALLRTRDEERRSPEPATQPQAPSKEQFLEQMNADPYGTIRGLIEEVAKPLVTTETTRTRNEITSEQRQNQALMSAAEQDRQATLEIANEFGEPGTPERDRFDEFADKELREITGRYGRYMPGHLEQAAARAERKMRTQGTNGNRGTNVRPFNRNVVRSSTGAPGGGDAGAPPAIAKTIDDLVAQKHLSTDEASEAKRNIKKWGLSEEKYVKNYIEASKENPRYGTGV